MHLPDHRHGGALNLHPGISMAQRRTDIFCIALVIILGIALYANAFSNNFVYDDQVTVQKNTFIRDWGNVSKFFSRDYYFRSEEYSFRPLVTLTYFLDYSFWKIDPRGYHLSNLIFHLLCSITVYLIGKKLLASRTAALLASVIFVVHPAQVEAVAGISFREDLLCAFFFFLSLLLYIKSERKNKIFLSLSKLSFALALLSKEMAVSFPLVIIAYEIIIRRRKLKVLFRPPVLSFFAIAAIYALARLFLLYQRRSLPAAPEFGNLLTRILIVFKGVGLYGKLLFFPLKLTVEYPDPLPPLAWSNYLIPAAFLTVGFILAAWIRSPKGSAAKFGIAFLFLALLPVLNIIPAARLGAERFLYLPILGFCLWAADVFNRLLNFRPPVVRGLSKTLSEVEGSPAENISSKAIIASVGLVIIFWGVGTISQNRVWRNNLTLFSRAVQVSPKSSRAHHGLGNEYFRIGRLNKAAEELKKAISIFSRDPLYFNSLGVVYGEMGRFEEALAQFQISARKNPGDPLVMMNLSTLYLRTGNISQALAEIDKYIAARPFDPEGYLNLGEIYINQGMYHQAINAYRQALRRDSNSFLALTGIGYCYYRLGDPARAREYWQKALRLDPDNPELRHNLKIISAE